jgi:hypothetical protein
MEWAELLLLLLVGWTVIGILGVILSFRRREYTAARRNLIWIAGIWLLYIGGLLTVSLTARPLLVPPGQEQRIGDLGFTVVHTEAQPGFLASHGERVLRISMRITNHSRGDWERDPWVMAYLLDSQNRRWSPIPGLQGIPLSANIAPGGSVLSQPVFKVAADATGLRLVLTHGPRLPNLLVVGDRDSLLHPPVSVPLPE